MSKALGKIKDVLETNFSGSLISPVVCSQAFDDRLLTLMDIAEWTVSNDSKLVEPLPFGMFGGVIATSANKSKLRIMTAPGFPDAVAFPEVCVKMSEATGDLTSQIVCRKVVPVADAIEVSVEGGVTIWECEIAPIDQVHGLRTTIKTPVIATKQVYSKTIDDFTPPRFKRLQPVTEESHIELGTAVEPTLATGEEQRAEEQVSTISKRVSVRKRSTAELPLSYEDQIAYVEVTTGKVTGTLDDEALTVETGLDVLKSEVTQLPDGRYARESVKADLVLGAWPILKGSKYFPLLNKSIQYTEQFVDPPTSVTGDALIEYVPINKDRTLKRVLSIPPDLATYYKTTPKEIQIPQLPRVLTGIAIVWNEAKEEGSQEATWSGASSGKRIGLSCNLNDITSGSVAATPELALTFASTRVGVLFGQSHCFYLAGSFTVADVLTYLTTKLGKTVSRWPVFHPQAHTIVCRGQKIDCTVRAQLASQKQEDGTNSSADVNTSKSSQFGVSMSNNTVYIPECLHDQIDFGQDAARITAMSVTATVSIPAEQYLPAATITKTDGSSLDCLVAPNLVTATTPISIPTTGIFLMGLGVEQSDEWGYTRVYAETLNAEDLWD